MLRGAMSDLREEHQAVMSDLREEHQEQEDHA
jgi:hypothetical protein